jgi:hypothetical protein
MKYATDDADDLVANTTAPTQRWPFGCSYGWHSHRSTVEPARSPKVVEEGKSRFANHSQTRWSFLDPAMSFKPSYTFINAKVSLVFIINPLYLPTPTGTYRISYLSSKPQVILLVSGCLSH